MTEPATPRKRPCASCPYRTEVAAGIWHEDEYDKLPRYDAETFAQPTQVFMCHQKNGQDVCSGWLGHTDPSQLLAVRIGILDGRVDPACADYQTDVNLFASGAEAAAHGKAGITEPSEGAAAAISKLIRSRGIRGDTLG